jgi:alkanesulfonate monooxygenase SsuD/methylene tetrahydromethanopterin reductase-like flavin-dependent oxidoreductase (luciferase family)
VVKVGIMLPTGRDDLAPGMAAWSDVVAVAMAAEAQGLDSVWAADHFFYRDEDGAEYGLHEAWTVLTAIAAVTSRVQLGPMVLCTSFREPGITAKMAASLDLVSDGRLILGLGCGWHDAEYESFGIPKDHRVGRFEEALEIIVRLLRGERVTFAGRFYRTADAVLAPPAGHHVPILIASRRPRMLELTARWADAWNSAWYGLPDDRLRTALDGIDAALTATGRPAAEVSRTIGIVVRDVDQAGPAEAESKAISAKIEELATALKTYEELGADQLIVSLEPATVRSVERLADAVRRHRGG